MIVHVRHVSAFALLAVSLSAFACSDADPLEFKGDESGPGDGGTVSPQVIAACKACMKDDGAPCRAAYDECASNERCVQLVDCAVDRGCFALPKLDQRLPCVSECMTEMGITTGSDPAIVQGLSVNACTLSTGPCSAACIPAP